MIPILAGDESDRVCRFRKSPLAFSPEWHEMQCCLKNRGDASVRDRVVRRGRGKDDTAIAHGK